MQVGVKSRHGTCVHLSSQPQRRFLSPHLYLTSCQPRLQYYNHQLWPVSRPQQFCGLSKALQPASRRSIHLPVSLAAVSCLTLENALELHIPNSQTSRNYTFDSEIHHHRDNHFFESKCEGVRVHHQMQWLFDNPIYFQFLTQRRERV